MDNFDKRNQSAKRAEVAAFMDTADSLEVALKALYADANKLQANLRVCRIISTNPCLAK